MIPTADHVAAALVAAARETGEDPIACASSDASLRYRHYAMHALCHCFQGLGTSMAATLVGCPGRGAIFYQKSWHQVAKTDRAGRRAAVWWKEDAYGRVIAAIEAEIAKTSGNAPTVPCEAARGASEGYRPPAGTIKRVLDDESDGTPADIGILEPTGYRPPPGTVAKVLQKDAAHFSGRVTMSPGPEPGRSALRNMLKRAVENTAKMPKGE